MHNNNTIDLNYEIESLLNKLILILTENHGEMSYKNLLKSIYNKYPNTKLYNILHRIINYKSKKLLHFLKQYPHLFQIYGGNHRAKFVKYLLYDTYEDEQHSEDELIEDTNITFEQALPYIQILFHNNNLNN